MQDKMKWQKKIDENHFKMYYREIGGKTVLINNIGDGVSIYDGNIKEYEKDDNDITDNIIYDISIYDPKGRLRLKEIKKDLLKWFNEKQAQSVVDKILEIGHEV